MNYFDAGSDVLLELNKMNSSNIINADVDKKGFVSDEVRDGFFQSMKNRLDNRVCFDCECRNPTWLSLSYAVFICLNCSSDHRKMGVHLSFVRSIDLDKFTPLQLLRIDIGGNSRARNYFKQTFGSHFSSKTREYANSIYGTQYKQILDNEISEIEHLYLKQTDSKNINLFKDFVSNKNDEFDVNKLQQDSNLKSVSTVVNRFNSIQRQNSAISNKGKRLDENFDFDSLVS